MAPHSKRRKLSDGTIQAVQVPKDAVNGDTTDSKKDQRRSLFVRSLPASVTSEKLAAHFSESYPLKHAVVVVDSKTNISRGFGFVTFTDAEDAQTAAEQFNNSSLDGRKIKVEVAESRHRDIEDGAKKGENTTATKLRAERDQQKQDAQPPKLIVRNLPWSIKTADDLTKLFLSYGKVKHAVVPKRGPKAQYGFGIVILRGKKNAEKALAGVNGKEVDGRTLAVDWAVDKETWQQLQQEELQNAAAADQEKENPQAEADDTSSSGSSTDDQGDEAGDNGSDGGVDVGLEDEDEIMDEENPEDDDDEASSSVSPSKPSPDDTTIFIRNLPYEADDESLKSHFLQFGPVRYARVVYDPETERSRGTAFVCFFNESDAKSCVKAAPKKPHLDDDKGGDKKRRGEMLSHSILQNEAEDPSGNYTLEGRVLQVSRALPKADADRRASEASDKRLKRDGDKRRLYLLSEGTISRSSKLYDQLGKAELDIRESSAKQRQKLIKTNPNLGLSLTRLSIRNLPRHIDSKELKDLARQAVVGFAADAKAGVREPLSRDELKRGGEEMKEAERKRKEKGVGLVRQAKIVFEGKEGTKVKDAQGGRSRGYGFIEYHTHRSALAGLRWLNGHQVKPKPGSGEKAKRLIVEFAIENAQVVQRRTEREERAREKGTKKPGEGTVGVGAVEKKRFEKRGFEKKGAEKKGTKRKRGTSDAQPEKVEVKEDNQEEKNRLAKRNRIISKKRQQRRTRKG